jgi:hypothetical protein
MGVHFTRAAPAAQDGFGLGFGPPLLGFIVGLFDLCLRPRLSGKWISFSSHGFLVFLGPFMCISCLALQNTTNTKTCGIN